MNMDFAAICQQYELGRFVTAVPLDPGTVARVWRLETDRGAFLLRTLTGREQGEREWSIAQRLLSRGFSRFPAILATVDGDFCLEMEGACLQVQELLTGTMPDPAKPGVAEKLAAVARDLSAALKPLIHGDLGPWNLVEREDGSLFVVDFGEAREGDPHYDYASLFGGVINHTPEACRETVCRDFIRALDCDSYQLLKQMERWAVENTARWTGRSEKMTARFSYALNWAKEHLYEL